MVYLVGAGPGDPGLITVRGLKCLQHADVVLYDHLVPAALLSHARSDAEKIDVGIAAPQPLEQEAICYLLVEKAREGRTVTRLKWGDPFVFDQGGSEALFLHEQGVRFEVVPGVPAALAAPTYAGVPLTVPGAGHTVTFLRGHEHEDEGRMQAGVDWTSLAKLDGTIVCCIGPDQLSRLLGTLIAHGRPPGEKAVLIYNGTLPSQETIHGSLEELARSAANSEERRPAILVVGRVAELREHVRWFDNRPLFGKRLVVTRPRERAAELIEQLESLGADVIEAPMIRILPPEDFGPLDQACAHIDQFDWVVFSSVHAVEAFLTRLLASPLDVRALKGVRLCCVGPATRDRLLAYGFKAELMPTEYRAEAVAEALSGSGDVTGLRIFVPRSDIGRDVVADELSRQGAIITEAVAYRTAPADPEREGGPDIYRMLLDQRVDVVTFASASAVRNFVRVLGAEPSADLLRTTVVACIGPVTAEAAAQSNIHATIVPSEYTIPALVEAIVEHFQRPAP